MTTKHQQLAKKFSADNRRAAEIILAAARPGERGLAVQWAFSEPRVCCRNTPPSSATRGNSKPSPGHGREPERN